MNLVVLGATGQAIGPCCVPHGSTTLCGLADTSRQSRSAGLPACGTVLSRGDVAHMMLDTVERGLHIKDTVWVRRART
jgi:hypothetical protein